MTAFLKNVAKHVAIYPALHEDWELGKEIKDYADVVKRSQNPQWDHCLKVLKTEYPPVGIFRIFSSPARYSSAEEIKMERARRILQPMVNLKFKTLSPEKISLIKD